MELHGSRTMPTSKQDKEFVNYIIELMQGIGPVSAKAMFGGHGIYLDGLMFALITDNVLYFKVNKEIEDEFISRNLEAFTYFKKGKKHSMSYYQAPEETLEDSEAMHLWANKSYRVAQSAAVSKRG